MTDNTKSTKENVLAGIIGALLFSLAGGALWFVLYQVGFLAGISGLVAVICSIKGYTIFSKGESLKGVVISIIAAVLVMILAWYLCLSLDVYKVYLEWYDAGEIDYTITFWEAIRYSYLFLGDSEVLLPYLRDLGFGLALCAVGAYRFVIDAVRKIKQEKLEPQTEPTVYEGPEV